MDKGSVFLRSHVNLTLVLHHFYNTREPLFQIRDLLLKISVFFAVFPQNLYCLLLACSERLFNTFTGSLIVSHILPVPVLNNRLPSFAMWASSRSAWVVKRPPTLSRSATLFFANRKHLLYQTSVSRRSLSFGFMLENTLVRRADFCKTHRCRNDRLQHGQVLPKVFFYRPDSIPPEVGFVGHRQKHAAYSLHKIISGVCNQCDIKFYSMSDTFKISSSTQSVKRPCCCNLFLKRIRLCCTRRVSSSFR